MMLPNPADNTGCVTRYDEVWHNDDGPDHSWDTFSTFSTGMGTPLARICLLGLFLVPGALEAGIPATRISKKVQFEDLLTADSSRIVHRRSPAPRSVYHGKPRRKTPHHPRPTTIKASDRQLLFRPPPRPLRPVVFRPFPNNNLRILTAIPALLGTKSDN